MLVGGMGIFYFFLCSPFCHIVVLLYLKFMVFFFLRFKL